MSLPKTGLDVDYVLAVDPGYGTQGVCIIDKAGNIREFFSSVATVSVGVHMRALWQIWQVKQAMMKYGPNCLLITEQFHAGMSSKASATSIYNRGWYDGLFRQHIEPLIRYSITAHNSAVWTFSEPMRSHKVVNGKKKWDKPTVEEILEYCFRLWPWLQPQERIPLDYWYRLENRPRVDGKLDSIESKEKSKMHATDALVMGCMAYVACLHPEFIFRCTSKQQKWIMQVHETYQFENTQEAGVR
jgi:Holliday junction resolvasome RuvABC endonuclease subunit